MLARSLSVGKQLATMLEQRESERARCKGKPTTFSRQPPHGRDAANVDGELLNGAEWRKAKRVKARGGEAGKRERALLGVDGEGIHYERGGGKK